MEFYDLGISGLFSVLIMRLRLLLNLSGWPIWQENQRIFIRPIEYASIAMLLNNFQLFLQLGFPSISSAPTHDCSACQI